MSVGIADPLITPERLQVRNPTIAAEFVDEEVSVIPEEYDTRSSLIREVGPGSNVLDFDLEGGAAGR
jgi:hypothetical protein